MKERNEVELIPVRIEDDDGDSITVKRAVLAPRSVTIVILEQGVTSAVILTADQARELAEALSAYF